MISIILHVALIGFILWLVNTYIPMPLIIKQVLTVAVAIALVLWLARVL